MENKNGKTAAQKAVETRRKNAEARRSAAQRQRKIIAELENIIMDAASTRAEKNNAIALLNAAYSEGAR